MTYRFAVNRRLERGERLADHAETDIELPETKVNLPQEYLLLYVSGHVFHRNPPRWSVENWVEAVEAWYNKYKFDIPIVILGAPYDWKATSRLRRMLAHRKAHWMQGTPQQNIYTIRNAKFFLSYQSGLGVVADNFNVPQLFVYFDKYAPMFYSWCKKRNVQTKFFADRFDTRPKDAIANLDWFPDGPLNEVAPGMWRQRSEYRITYQDSYFDNYVAMAQTEVDRSIKQFRVDLVRSHGCKSVLDVGIGNGAFIAMFGDGARGYDVMRKAIKWLKSRDLFQSPYLNGESPDAITCWDSLEHMENPTRLLDSVKPGGHLFLSLPIFTDLDDVLRSKHYRPGEHLYYWTDEAMKTFAESRGLKFVASTLRENELGREGIGTYVFVRPQ